MTDRKRQATFGGGCFWCVEAAFDQLEGVERTISGYAGGSVPDPSYEAVCSGTTGHAEVVQVDFDAATLAYEDLLEVFFTVHDPTTKDRQGPDVGEQYRSIVLYHDDDQREKADAYVQALDQAGAYDAPIVTEIEPLETFYPAEEYHQNYFEKNPANAYCRMHVAPKVQKVRQTFESLLAQ